MNCRIIIDSGGEYTEKMKQNDSYRMASLSIELDGEVMVDDETLIQSEFLKKIADSPNCPKSSCPSPETYMELYRGECENVYVVPISTPLSGSHNSAVLAVDLYREEYGEKNIHVFDTKNASIGNTLICYKIYEYEEQGLPFLEIVDRVNEFIKETKIVFVLENLETLRKNGRLTGIKSVLASALNIKPIMTAVNEGEIAQIGQGRGVKKALHKLVDQVAENVVNPEEKILGIGHCNCLERAEYVKQLLEERLQVKEIFIEETSGISTMYANDGGILVSV